MTVSALKQSFLSITTLQDEKDLKTRVDAMNKCNSQWEELLGSCKSAFTELKKVSNQKSTSASAKGKSKAKAKAKNKAKTSAEAYGMFDTDAEFKMCPSSEADDETSQADKLLLGTPFKGVLDKASDFISDAACKALDKFAKEFASSDIRVMTGKAQQETGPLKNELRPGRSDRLRGVDYVRVDADLSCSSARVVSAGASLNSQSL